MSFVLTAEKSSRTETCPPEPEGPPRTDEGDFKPTPQQQAILDAVADGHSHLAVNAVAGASKTTTCVKASSLAGPRCGFLAFNKTIADELKGRLGTNAQASTMHSLGFRMLSRSFAGIQLDERKKHKHLQEHFPELHEEGKGKWAGRFFLKQDYAPVLDMVSICKSQLLDPIGDADWQSVLHVCDASGIELPDDDGLDTCREATSRLLETALADTESCDFDDMVWMPVALDLVKPQFATLFIDEAQDLGPCQQELALRSGDRFVVVGDPRQAIYGFAGADTASFRTLACRLGDCVELPLTVSFRCPTAHGELARLLVPHFETAAWAQAGQVLEPDPDKAAGAMQVGDMVVCRKNAPVVSLAYKLIEQGKPVLVRGLAIGEGLVAVVKKLRATDIEQLEEKLDKWESKQIAKLGRREGTEGAKQQVQDKATCLRTLAGAAGSIDDLVDQIGRLFADSDPGNRIVLSSIHRAKGLERKRIFFWEPGLCPMGRDLQEQNLIYVAMTRSKSELYLVDDQVRRKQPTKQWLEMIAGGAGKGDLVHRSGLNYQPGN